MTRALIPSTMASATPHDVRVRLTCYRCSRVFMAKPGMPLCAECRRQLSYRARR